METQTNEQPTQTVKPQEWLKQESEQLGTHEEFDTLPSLQFIENKIVEFEIDFSKPFEKWNDTVNKLVKAIIPVTHENEKKNLWLNTKNPLYKQIIDAGQTNQIKFKVLQTGNKANTKYTVVEE